MILPFCSFLHFRTVGDAGPYNFNGYDARACGICAALNDWVAAQECGQYRTTIFRILYDIDR